MAGTGIAIARRVPLPRIPGQYVMNALSNATAAPAQSEVRVAWVFLDDPLTIDRIAVEVTASAVSSFVRPVIYASDSSGRPSTVLVDGGQIDASTNGIKEATVSAVIPRGITWWGSISQGGTPTVRVANVAPGPLAMDLNVGFNLVWPRQTGATGAPPAFGAQSGYRAETICVRVRLA